jgi:hypothetical protein
MRGSYFIYNILQSVCPKTLASLSCSASGLIEGGEEQVGSSNMQIQITKEPNLFMGQVSTRRKLGILLSACKSGDDGRHGLYHGGIGAVEK